MFVALDVSATMVDASTSSSERMEHLLTTMTPKLARVRMYSLSKVGLILWSTIVCRETLETLRSFELTRPGIRIVNTMFTTILST
jgi:hypothetical protein